MGKENQRQATTQALGQSSACASHAVAPIIRLCGKIGPWDKALTWPCRACPSCGNHSWHPERIHQARPSAPPLPFSCPLRPRLRPWPARSSPCSYSGPRPRLRQTTGARWFCFATCRACWWRQSALQLEERLLVLVLEQQQQQQNDSSIYPASKNLRHPPLFLLQLLLLRVRLHVVLSRRRRKTQW